MKYDTQTPYAACFVIIRHNGKIAFLLRQNTPWMNGFYDLASGKVEKDESYLQAAVREVKEEMGVDVDKDDLVYALTMHRKNKDQDMVWADIYFEAKKWRGEPRNAEPHVHGELSWFDPEELPDNIVPSVRAALEAINSGKNYAEYGWD
ncbi:MAG TPA: NUDIX domain-containing protein [Candidatus Saccharimonadales bacterium]|nr:NUDIX domain-containing protein [Candidatus Saccharimonadales bacterium]